MDRISVSLDSGVFFKRRISILYDQITDVTMSQGPLQSLFGIWELRIHTPGSPDEVSEYRGYDKTASALGLTDPDKARNLLLSACQRAKGK